MLDNSGSGQKEGRSNLKKEGRSNLISQVVYLRGAGLRVDLG